MEFVKKNIFNKNIFWIIIFFVGLLLIYKSCDYGRTYFVDFISKNDLHSYLEIFLNMSIVRYIAIGVLLSLLGIKKIEK